MSHNSVGAEWCSGSMTAHLFDGLSALVVHQLAQSGGARLVVTMRTGSEEPDAVTLLYKDGLLARLDLEPLSAAATRESRPRWAVRWTRAARLGSGS